MQLSAVGFVAANDHMLCKPFAFSSSIAYISKCCARFSVCCVCILRQATVCCEERASTSMLDRERDWSTKCLHMERGRAQCVCDWCALADVPNCESLNSYVCMSYIFLVCITFFSYCCYLTCSLYSSGPHMLMCG